MNRLFPLLFALLLLPACRQSYTPRPYGYFRVTLPPHAYVPVQDDALPFRFDRSALAEVRPRPAQGDGLWLDLYYPWLNADIHCSYKPVRGNLRELSEDARRFVYAHSDRADDISERLYEHPERHVYGLLYDLKGNVVYTLKASRCGKTIAFVGEGDARDISVTITNVAAADSSDAAITKGEKGVVVVPNDVHHFTVELN